jgi:flagellar hook-length control protein FliK
MTIVSSTSALFGASSAASKNAAAAAREDSANASFEATLKNMAAKANEEAQATKAAAAAAATASARAAADAKAAATQDGSVHDAPQPDEPSAVKSDSDTQAADPTKTAAQASDDAASADKAAKAAAAQAAKNGATPQTPAQKAAAAAAATSAEKARESKADADVNARPDTKGVNTADQIAANAAATDDSDAPPGSAHKSTEAKSTPDAAQSALAALANGQGMQAGSASEAAAAAAATANSAKAATGGGDAKKTDEPATGRVAGLDGGKRGRGGDAVAPQQLAQATQANAQQAEATALAGASGSHADDGTAAYKATEASVDAAANASALQAAPGNATVQDNAVPATSAAIAPHVGSSGWDEALSQKVVFLTNAHQSTAELTLNPKDLGPLQVVLQVADNHAHALFVSEHAQVREAVEAALPQLREAMAANGIGLGSTSVSDGFGGRSGARDDYGRVARAGQGFGGGDSGPVGASAAAVGLPVRRQVGLVDTFA